MTRSPRARVDVVPNGIDIDRISSIEPATEGFDVLYAGRLIEDKHIDRLIDAFATATADDQTAQQPTPPRAR